jgi:hypothetical protein
MLKNRKYQRLKAITSVLYKEGELKKESCV